MCRGRCRTRPGPGRGSGWSSIARRQAVSIAAHRRSIQATNASTWRPSADSPCSSRRGGQRLSRGGAGLARGDHAEDGREDGDLREAGPRRRMRRIEADGLLEGAKGPGEVLLRREGAGPSDSCGRPRGSRAAAGREPRAPRGEPGLDGLDDARGDLVLDGEDVRGLPVEALRPELVAARDVGQLRGDAQPARPTSARCPRGRGPRRARGRSRADRRRPAARGTPRSATRRGCPSIRTSAFMISSAIPSQRYSWSFAGLMSENGSTAIATAVAAPRRRIGLRRHGHVEPRLAQAVDQALHVLRLPPLLEVAARAWRRSPAAA